MFPRRRGTLSLEPDLTRHDMPLSARIPRSVLMLACIACVPHPASAHDDHCSAIVTSVDEAGFSDEVSVSCDDGHANIVSDAYPDHELMTGIVGTNEQVPVPAESLVTPIPLAPMLGDTPVTRDSSLGVTVNGVPIFDYTAGGEMSEADLHHHQTQHDTLLTQQLDVCGGHAGRGDDYHYHVKPVCMIEQMVNRDDDPIIGWALDGFPIYGDDNPDGSAVAAGALDVCNGQPDDVYGYRYHTSEEAPYIVQCLMGAVGDPTDLPRVSPLRAADGGAEPEPGRPPAGGVDDLTFTEGSDGVRSMDYRHEGEAYYLRYSESDTPGCYDFETRTVTNGGDVRASTLCR